MIRVQRIKVGAVSCEIERLRACQCRRAWSPRRSSLSDDLRDLSRNRRSRFRRSRKQADHSYAEPSVEPKYYDQRVTGLDFLRDACAIRQQNLPCGCLSAKPRGRRAGGLGPGERNLTCYAGLGAWALCIPESRREDRDGIRAVCHPPLSSIQGARRNASSWRRLHPRRSLDDRP